MADDDYKVLAYDVLGGIPRWMKDDDIGEVPINGDPYEYEPDEEALSQDYGDPWAWNLSPLPDEEGEDKKNEDTDA